MITTDLFDKNLEAIIQCKINELNENYEMVFPLCSILANDFDIVKQVINIGIDPRLNAITYKHEIKNDKVHITFLDNSLFIFLYRLLDLFEKYDNEKYYDLYSDILYTLDIELI